jgi:hypothetical protein
MEMVVEDGGGQLHQQGTSQRRIPSKAWHEDDEEVGERVSFADRGPTSVVYQGRQNGRRSLGRS